MPDLLIKNGTVIDGTGGPGKTADVAIHNGRITDIAANLSGNFTRVIDAKDRLVTPGFIDIQNHSDSYWTIFDQPEQASLLAQGITTVVVGNCGASLAPLLSPESIKGIQKWHSLQGLNINWATINEFFSVLGKLPLGVNVATLVGHSTLRRGLIGDKVKALDVGEIKVLETNLKESLNQGALGMSLGLIYSHEMNSSREELVQLAGLLKPTNKYLSVHLRSEASHILESLQEVIELSLAADVPVKISHLKIRGEKNWHLFDQVMSKLTIAYHQGTKISFDVYPYDSSWSVLYTYLPKWAYEGGRDNILKTLQDSMSRRKVLDHLREQNHDYGSIIVATAPGNNFAGKTLRQIAGNQNVSVEEALLNVITATQAQVIVFDKNLSMEQVEILCNSPLSMIATDGAGYSHTPDGLVHPRCFGTMPKFLHMVASAKSLKWENAITKITSEPAKLMGLTDRGVLAPGKQADVVVFDPNSIIDRGDYAIPDRLPEGIDAVIVGGKVSFEHNALTTTNGTVIRR